MDTQTIDPAVLAERISRNGNLRGINAANKTIQLVEAAMAIASRASEAQLQDSGIRAPRYPGTTVDAFKKPTLDANPPQFLARLGKFIEPEYLRQNLMDFAVANGTGFASDGVL